MKTKKYRVVYTTLDIDFPVRVWKFKSKKKAIKKARQIASKVHLEPPYTMLVVEKIKEIKYE